MAESEVHDFAQFMRRREAAATAYIQGDAAPVLGMTAHTGDATFYAPTGGSVTGAESVVADFASGAQNFAPGGTNAFEILQMAASDGLAFWVGFQRAAIHVKGRGEAVPFNLRVTEIFRREGTEWQLIHRHADPLINAQSR
ncbi:MAG TPA: nuclear transport factor 2 family protein [Ktedonobacterales bacterium]|nr:nuclear transport factor 2 family protein [Ktedonobacterales bacterium]